MNKNAIKIFATEARRELISRVSQRALKYGISEKEVGNPNDNSVNGHLLSSTEKKQRAALIEQIKEKGYEQVMEEVAYTWFNRFSALRFMEVNGYLPTRVRVFTDENNSFKPQILTEAIHMELDGLDMEKVYAYKEANDDDELYKYLLITQCNALNNVLSGMFQRLSDYTELLFPDNLLREGSVVHQMIERIDEDDWKDAVQIIGWLYQYYNSETFNEIYDGDMSRKKIDKFLLPAATQMFTPDWVIQYMVQNSLGYLWNEGHSNSELANRWKYLLTTPEQTSESKVQIDRLKFEYQKITPYDITCLDPCSGSGHILAYMFDVLVQIYETYGVDTRSAVTSIVENNIYGLDIDDRAAQLSYFTVMMKACQYDKRFLLRKVQPHVYAIIESNHVDRHAVEYFCNGDAKLKEAMETIIKELHDAKEYGSIIKVSSQDWDVLYERFDEIQNESVQSIYSIATLELKSLVQVAEVIANQYDVVVTNPPYLNSSRMSPKLNKYVKDFYPDSRFDLCMVMYDAIKDNFVKNNRVMSLVTTTSWMFISSFEEVRKKAVHELDFQSIIDFGTELFDGKIGHLPITAWVNIKSHSSRRFTAIRLVDYCYGRRDEKQKGYFDTSNHYITDESWFDVIDGNPLCYWISPEQITAFKNNDSFVSISPPRTGMMTTNNKRFLREWYEVKFDNISLSSDSIEASCQSGKKWFPYNKGGDFQRWYGNRDLIVNWQNAGSDIAAAGMTSFRGKDFYFKEGLTWTIFGYDNFAVRYSPVGSIFDIGGTSTFPPHNLLYYFLGYLNSRVASDFITLINPTVNIQNGDVKRLPIIIEENAIRDVTEVVKENVGLVKMDYDSNELSWDFIRHPLAINSMTIGLGAIVKNYQEQLRRRFNTLKSNEEGLNKYFSKLYGVEDITTIEVPDKKVSIKLKDKEELIKEFISYAVGCMFGRYSLDVEGLAYAGGDWDASKYPSFAADKDNIIPICDDEYFEDDIVGCFVKFVEVVYGKETLQENLKFIADALGGNGQPKEVIRKYFLNGFYADHCKMYQKRPIYWLFDSGTKNGFKALIYMHRYQPDILARIRTDYVYEQQARYRTAIEYLDNRMANASTSERVKLNKQLKTLNDQATEIHEYEEKIHHLADQMISIDLDDGVKNNYAIFQDVLAKIK